MGRKKREKIFQGLKKLLGPCLEKMFYSNPEKYACRV